MNKNTQKNQKISGGKAAAIFILIAAVVFGLIFAGLELTKNIGKSGSQISQDEFDSKLGRLIKNIGATDVPARKGEVELQPAELAQELPDINQYPLTLQASAEISVEIFSSTEKSGSGMDGWLVEAGRNFNRSNPEINGKSAAVSIRSVSSGLAYDYIRSGKYVPEAFTPSNELWGEMLKAAGVQTEMIAPRLAGNVAGIVMEKAQYDQFVADYGSVNVRTIAEATAADELAMGYTNPFASSAGLNFVASLLSNFDGDDPLSANAISSFENFQKNIPFVAYSTIQMRDAVKSGSLKAMILEYQTFKNTDELRSYVFTPYGARHDSPIYAVGDVSAEKRELIKLFADFCVNADSQQLADKYGFNGMNDYINEMRQLDGTTLISAQKLWKEKKDAGRPVIAVFVADVSGSMGGEPIYQLKNSLLNGANYINPDNSIGLVSYSSKVYINLPIAKFDLNQRAYFNGAVQDLSEGGGTATFDAIAVALDMLMKARQEEPNAKLMMFVLSDGDTNEGHSLRDVQGLIKSSGVPIYTIGYNADIKALNAISSINEAASINADSADVVYALKNFFNAQM
ncbi:MAG: VWA domain-containing protein [Oscillospiraceae bacterium]|nr:VWA domain-containing protein [Oscillospiraceae bacterium]